MAGTYPQRWQGLTLRVTRAVTVRVRYYPSVRDPPVRVSDLLLVTGTATAAAVTAAAGAAGAAAAIAATSAAADAAVAATAPAREAAAASGDSAGDSAGDSDSAGVPGACQLTLILHYTADRASVECSLGYSVLGGVWQLDPGSRVE